MSKLIEFTLTEALDGLDKGEFTARELTQAHLDAIGAAAPLNAFITDTSERALSMADASDERRKKGEAGLIEGAPIAVKDLFCTRGVETTACSAILKGFVPEYESTVTSQLWRDGAVMLGKLNCDEFAMGSANETSVFGAADRCPEYRGFIGRAHRKFITIQLAQHYRAITP